MFNINIPLFCKSFFANNLSTVHQMATFQNFAINSTKNIGKNADMSNIKTQLLSTLVMSSAVMLAGCNNSETTEVAAPAEEATSSTSQEAYKVYTDGDGMPFTFRDEHGAVQGFDIDVMNAVAEDQGFAVDYEILPWSVILPSMEQDKADLAIAHISITDERAKIHKYSTPYFESSQVALVKPELAELTSFAELKDAKVDVLKDSITDDLFTSLNIPVTSRDKIYPMITDLVNGDVDAVALDVGILKYYQKEFADKNFAIIEDTTIPVDNYGIIVNKTNPELLNKVNAGLRNIKENGKYQQIEKKWFAN